MNYFTSKIAVFRACFRISKPKSVFWVSSNEKAQPCFVLVEWFCKLQDFMHGGP